MQFMEDTFATAATFRAGGEADFAAMAATLDPAVVLHQSPDLPWGGEYHGHEGYEHWAKAMSAAFDRLEVKERRLYADRDTAVVMCRLITRSRATGDTLDLPMVQIVRVRDDRIVEFRPSTGTSPYIGKRRRPDRPPREARVDEDIGSQPVVPPAAERRRASKQPRSRLDVAASGCAPGRRRRSGIRDADDPRPDHRGAAERRNRRRVSRRRSLATHRLSTRHRGAYAGRSR